MAPLRLRNRTRTLKARRSTARSILGAATAAVAAHLATPGMSLATPINFVLSGASATFTTGVETTVDFSGSFTFDASTGVETNIAVTASPTSPSDPDIVSSYTAGSSPLCTTLGSFVTNPLCLSDPSGADAILIGFSAPLDGATTPDPINLIWATLESGNPDVANVASSLTGAADVVTSEPSALFLLVTAFGLWLLSRRVVRRRSPSQYPDAA